MKDINPETLRTELIDLYEEYLSERDGVEQHAEELDGLWSGSFLFPEEIERAINAVSFMYIDPRMSKERARELLDGLKQQEGE